MNVLWFSLRIDLNYPSQAFNQAWINEMAGNVSKIIVVTLYEGEYQLVDNVKVYSIGKEKGYSKIRQFFTFYKILFRILKREKIDMVFSHMAVLFTAMAGPIFRVKRIPIFQWYCHGSVTLKLRLAVLFSKRVITCSNQGMNVSTKKKMVVGHGINIEIFKYLPNMRKGNLLLHVGRISPVKNIHMLIDVMNGLVHEKKLKEIRLVLIGEPMELKKDQNYFFKLKMEVKQKKLAKHVFFLGMKSQTDLVQYYRDSKILLNLSDTRSLDKVILEAMACGCIPLSANESFKALYQNRFPQLVVSKDTTEIAEKILYLLTMKIQDIESLKGVLRGEVEKNYSLDGFMNILYKEMEKSVRI